MDDNNQNNPGSFAPIVGNPPQPPTGSMPVEPPNPLPPLTVTPDGNSFQTPPSPQPYSVPDPSAPTIPTLGDQASGNNFLPPDQNGYAPPPPPPTIPAENSNQSSQAYYVGTVPAEKPANHPGRITGIFGIVCAVVSLLLLPPLFGLMGIILGVVSLKKGEKTLGIIAIVLSAVLMIAGLIISLFIYSKFTGGDVIVPGV